MKHLTQTRRENCLQTCVAILLDRDPEELPQQHEYASHDAYGKALRVYLDKHHGLTYAEVPQTDFDKARAQAKTQSHIMIGPCSRTSPENGEAWHAVIGHSGVLLWDVSPTRAGLTAVEAWGFLIPTPPGWRETWSGETCGCASCRDDLREVA